MTFAGRQFNGTVTYDAFWAYDPGFPLKKLPEPWRPAARWCNRCWRLVPNGQRTYRYGCLAFEFDICRPCHLAIIGEPTRGEPGE